MASNVTTESTAVSNRLLLAVAIVLIAFATVLGVITAGDNVLQWDLRFSSSIQQWQGDVPAILHRIGDMLGDTVFTVIVLLGLVVIAAIMRSKRFFAFFVAVGLLRLSGKALKELFDSPRPIEAEQRIRIYENFDGTGFPSGHSMTAAMFATILVVSTWSLIRYQRARWIAALVGLVIMVFIGWTRIWSGAHWPTDVLGGWSFGIALVLIAWVITKPFADSHIELASEPAPE